MAGWPPGSAHDRKGRSERQVTTLRNALCGGGPVSCAAGIAFATVLAGELRRRNGERG